MTSSSRSGEGKPELLHFTTKLSARSFTMNMSGGVTTWAESEGMVTKCCHGYRDNFCH